MSTITELHGAILISDLPESATYKFLDPPEEVLAMVQPPKGEAEEEAEEAEAEAEAAAEGAAEPEAEAGAAGAAEAEGAPAPE